MNMIVCCKQIFDPEAPPASFKIDAANNKVIPPNNVPLVINKFNQNSCNYPPNKCSPGY